MILFGASGHAKVIIDILQGNNIEINAIFDDFPKLDSIFSIPVLKSDKIPSFQKEALIAIGSNKIRKIISEKYLFNYVKGIHQKAVISKYVSIGEGSVIMANAVINADVKIGKHCIVNTSSVIEHDCKIGDFAHISPNAALAGNVEIAEGTHVGIGASIIQGVKIGKWATIGAGAVIIKDIPDYATVVGNPGRIIKIEEKNAK